jgi:hypothetical protein
MQRHKGGTPDASAASGLSCGLASQRALCWRTHGACPGKAYGCQALLANPLEKLLGVSSRITVAFQGVVSRAWEHCSREASRQFPRSTPFGGQITPLDSERRSLSEEYPVARWGMRRLVDNQVSLPVPSDFHPSPRADLVSANHVQLTAHIKPSGIDRHERTALDTMQLKM